MMMIGLLLTQSSTCKSASVSHCISCSRGRSRTATQTVYGAALAGRVRAGQSRFVGLRLPSDPVWVTTGAFCRPTLSLSEPVESQCLLSLQHSQLLHWDKAGDKDGREQDKAPFICHRMTDRLNIAHADTTCRDACLQMTSLWWACRCKTPSM